ncbi:hypothetical protein M9H77_31716 [Catharanthus roseus]|uniref:Uncharacterized protein n=1 Tax=Catharanthus roseus TaxID=4058 RepID=A0ACC0A1R6_CATRO|nr:hypothetical protein M9H77_31716 [Catharanthus roseus]
MQILVEVRMLKNEEEEKEKGCHLELGLQKDSSIAYASYTILIDQMFATWMLPYEDLSTFCIYNKHTFKRMGFERNEEGLLVRGGQNESDEHDKEDDEEQEEMNVDEEESDPEPEVETHRKEIRKKKRQEKTEEGSSSVDMAQLMARIITMKPELNSRLDDIDGKLHNRLDDIDEKIVDIQNRNKRSIFGVSRLHYIEAKDLGDQSIIKKKRSSHSKINA